MCARHPAAARGSGRHDCLGYSDDLRDEVWHRSRGKRRRSHRTEARLSINNGDLLARLVLNGEGIALLPHFIVEADLEAGRLVEVLPNWTTTEIWLTLYYPPCEQLPLRTAIFSDFFDSHVGETCLAGLKWMDLPARGRSHIPLR